MAWGPRGLLALSPPHSCEVSVVRASRTEAGLPLPCVTLSAPTASLCWAPYDIPLLLASDLCGGIALCARRDEDAAFACVARFDAEDALRALRWLDAASWMPRAGGAADGAAGRLPLGIEAFVAVGACGKVVLRWRSVSASALAAAVAPWTAVRGELPSRHPKGGAPVSVCCAAVGSLGESGAVVAWTEAPLASQVLVHRLNIPSSAARLGALEQLELEPHLRIPIDQPHSRVASLSLVAQFVAAAAAPISTRATQEPDGVGLLLLLASADTGQESRQLSLWLPEGSTCDETDGAAVWRQVWQTEAFKAVRAHDETVDVSCNGQVALLGCGASQYRLARLPRIASFRMADDNESVVVAHTLALPSASVGQPADDSQRAKRPRPLEATAWACTSAGLSPHGALVALLGRSQPTTLEPHGRGAAAVLRMVHVGPLVYKEDWLETVKQYLPERSADPWDLITCLGSQPREQRNATAAAVGKAISRQLEALLSPNEVPSKQAERVNSKIALVGPRLVAMLAALYGIVRRSTPLQPAAPTDGAVAEVEAAIAKLAGAWRAHLMLWISAELLKREIEAEIGAHAVAELPAASSISPLPNWVRICEASVQTRAGFEALPATPRNTLLRACCCFLICCRVWKRYCDATAHPQLSRFGSLPRSLPPVVAIALPRAISILLIAGQTRSTEAPHQMDPSRLEAVYAEIAEVQNRSAHATPEACEKIEGQACTQPGRSAGGQPSRGSHCDRFFARG